MWFDNLINVHSAVQGIVILSLICTLGLALGKIHVKGISLGIAFVFFVGIIAGHLGLSIDQNMLEFAESFGLTMFVYVLGLVKKYKSEASEYICGRYNWEDVVNRTVEVYRGKKRRVGEI